MNRAILIAAGLLVVLIAFFLFVSSFFTKRDQKPGSYPTPIPTGLYGSKAAHPDIQPEEHFPYSQDETARLTEFKKKLPYSSSNLEITFSDQLGLFFVQKKTGEADAELKALLENAGLTEIYKNRSALFVSTDIAPSQAIASALQIIEEIQQNVKNAQNPQTSSAATSTQQDKDIAALGDLSQTLFGFEVPTLPPVTPRPTGSNVTGQPPGNNSGGKPSGKSSSGGGGQPAGKGGTGTCTTGGGYPFSDRSQSIIGRPYQGTHTLGNWQSDNAIDFGTPMGTPVCAISAGSIGSIKMHDPNPSSRYAGIAVYLDTYGGQWWYMHLSSIAPGISTGVTVKAGQTIGYTGAANSVPHLHLGFSSGNPVSILGL